MEFINVSITTFSTVAGEIICNLFILLASRRRRRRRLHE
jgi:hypothetical protein